MEQEEAKVINTFLKTFGDVALNQPRFRLVWSNEQFELRKGTFTDVVNGVVIRTVSEVRRTRKYDWIDERWLLEQWQPPSLVYDVDLPNTTRGDYVCLYVFQDGKGNQLPLNKLVVEIIMSRIMDKPRTPAQIASDIQNQMDKTELERSKYFEDVLNDDSPLVSAFGAKMAILSPDIGVPSHNLRKRNAG